MKSTLAVLGLAAILDGVLPVPLIAGAVRDQFGDPIEAATVQAGDARTQTSADGTFALRTAAARVRITCTYCRPTEARVSNEGTVAAIVQRYHALAAEPPSPQDLRALPYARVESALALAPFIVLNESGGVLPGPRVSRYGLSRFGGLVLDDGIASYDFAAGLSPWRSFADYGAASVAQADSSQAFRYGDLAGAGTFFVDTRPESGQSTTALFGTHTALDVASAAPQLSYSFADSSGDSDSHARADASARFLAGNDTFSATAVAARDRERVFDQNAASNVSAVLIHWDRTRSIHAYADLVADRAAYAAFFSSADAAGAWSDVQLRAGMSTTAPVSAFAELGARVSSGFYDAYETDHLRAAGTSVQTHVSVGAHYQSDRFTWTAGLSAFDAAYAGGTGGFSTPLSADIIVPSAEVRYAFTPRWNLEVDAGVSFRLPTLLEAYAYDRDDHLLAFDRYTQQSATLGYTDRHRLRASFTAMSARVSNLDNGNVTAMGASLAWQIAPELSLRAWTLHFDDTTRPSADVLRFGAAPLPATPASIWATYENPHGLRADLIWRSDLIDYQPDAHVDASISAPLLDSVRWFIGSERLRGRRSIEAGLRLDRS